MATRTDQEQPAIQLIGFGVGEKRCAADIMSVREILRNPSFEPTAQGPEFICGTILLRGEALPVIDLRHFLGESPEGPVAAKWALIARTHGHETCLLVDSVTRIVKIDAGDLLPAPDLILDNLLSHYIRGICTTESGTFVVLDFESILGPAQVQEISKFKVPSL